MLVKYIRYLLEIEQFSPLFVRTQKTDFCVIDVYVFSIGILCKLNLEKIERLANNRESSRGLGRAKVE